MATRKKKTAKKKATAPKKAKKGSKKTKKKSPAKKAAKKSAKKAAKKATKKKSAKPKRSAAAKPKKAAAKAKRKSPTDSAGAGTAVAARAVAKAAPPRRRRETTLPPDHEVLSPGPLRGSPVDKEVVIEAVKAALQAVEEHPIKGTEFIGRRSRTDLPREGEIDYAIAQEAQKAARELLAADEAAREEQREVDERIAQVYASEAAQFEQEDDE